MTAQYSATVTEDENAQKELVEKKGTKLSVKDIMKNPALAKLIVRAAKNVKATQEKESSKTTV
jgi:hypothetical protein